MNNTKSTFFEKKLSTFFDWIIKYKFAFISSVAVGFIAHGFSFSNKLVQQDDLTAFFGKGSSVSSGRWGLEIMSSIMPDVSMPWVYGCISLLLLTIAAIVIIDTFKINNRLFQMLFSGIFISVPAVTGFFTIPFVAAPNSLAVLCACICVNIFIYSRRKLHYLIGILILSLSMGIYQAYITLASSLIVVFLIQQLLKNELTAKESIIHALKYLALLALGVALYAILTFAVLKITHTELLSYAYSEYGILMRIRVAYTSFIGFLFKGYFSYVNSTVSVVAHVAIFIICAAIFIRLMASQKNTESSILAVIYILLLPLSINAMYLASSVDVLGTIVFYSFTSIYLLAITVFSISEEKRIFEVLHLKNIVQICMCIIVVSNIYFSNKVYLKMYMQTENMRSFYTGVMTQVMGTEGYDGTQKLALFCSPDKIVYKMNEIDTSNFIGFCSEDVYGIYTRYDFIKIYLGYDIPFAEEMFGYYGEYREKIDQMSIYPADGSIQIMDDYIVVKLY